MVVDVENTALCQFRVLLGLLNVHVRRHDVLCAIWLILLVRLVLKFVRQRLLRAFVCRVVESVAVFMLHYLLLEIGFHHKIALTSA